MINIKVLVKLLIIQFLPIESFCKECGCKVCDFSAPDDIWEEVDVHIKYGHVLCYNCFCKKCKKLGLPSVWRLEEILD